MSQSFNIMLINIAVSIGDDEKISKIISESGFSDDNRPPSFGSLGKHHFGTFEGQGSESVISEIEQSINKKCKQNGIGAFDFILIDITGSNFKRSIWHDGFY